MADVPSPVRFMADPLSDLRQLLHYPFMVHALEAGTLVALIAAVTGWFMVLRRASFAGHTLSVMAFPGASGALLLGLAPAIGLYCAGGAAGAAIGVLAGGAGHRESGRAAAVTGSVQALGLAAGFVFLSLYHGILGGYEGLLFGDFLGITQGQVLALAAVAAGAGGALAVIGRPLLFASVDEAVARAAGVPVRLLGAAFLVVLGLAVAATAQITGALLVFSLLVAPAATAQRLTARVGRGLALAGALGVLETWGGLAWAFFSDLPVGFAISTIALVGYAAAGIAAPGRPGAAARRRAGRLGPL